MWPRAEGGKHQLHENAVPLRLAGRERDNTMADDRLSFKQMCAEFDVTPRTLRYYEYIELLQPDREGRSRFYGARECACVALEEGLEERYERHAKAGAAMTAGLRAMGRKIFT